MEGDAAVEPGAGQVLPGGTHPVEFSGGQLQRPVDSTGQAGRVGGRRGQPGDPIDDLLGKAADCGHDHRGGACGIGFQGNAPEWLRARRDDNRPQGGVDEQGADRRVEAGYQGRVQVKGIDTGREMALVGG